MTWQDFPSSFSCTEITEHAEPFSARIELPEHYIRVGAEIPCHARVVSDADRRTLFERTGIASERYALKRAVRIPTIARFCADRHLEHLVPNQHRLRGEHGQFHDSVAVRRRH